jgi:hypothetical protein
LKTLCRYFVTKPNAREGRKRSAGQCECSDAQL